MALKNANQFICATINDTKKPSLVIVKVKEATFVPGQDKKKKNIKKKRSSEGAREGNGGTEFRFATIRNIIIND